MDLVPRLLRRWTFWLVLAGLFLAYVAAGFFLVPWLVRSQARDFVAETYQRELGIGEVRFNPFTLALDVRDVALPDRDRRPMLEFDRFFVNFQAISLFRRAWSFEEIILDRPGARLVVRPDGTINFADLAPPESAQVDPEPLDAPPPRIRIERFAVTGGRADVEDVSRPTPFTASLKPITFTLLRFSTTGSGDNAYQLAAESQRGENLAWRGTFSVSPVSSTGSFQLAGVHARTVWEYLRDALMFEIPSGTLELDGRYQFSLARTPILKVYGDSVRTRGLALRPKGADSDWIALDALEFGGATIDVLTRKAEIANVTLRGGTLRTWLDAGGHFNLPQLFAGEAATNEPTPVPEATDATAPVAPAAVAQDPDAGSNESDWVLSVPRIEVANLKVLTEDRTIEPAVAWELAPVNATIGGFTTAAGAKLAIDADVGIDGEGKFAAHGTLEPDTSLAAFDLEIEKLDLRPFQPYLDRHTDMTLTSGRLGFKGHLDLKRAADETVQPDFRGKVELTALRTIDNALEQDFLRWERLTLNDLDYQGARNRLTIREIAARRPYARVIIASDGSVNIATVLQKGAAEEETGEPATQPTTAAPAGAAGGDKASPLFVRIGIVRLDRMSANFADYSLQPNFATGIEELNGTITGLSSAPGSRAKVDLDGKVDAYAPVTIDGEVNYLSADAYTDLKLSFDNMELTTFTPYSGKFAGYRIEKGKLSVDLNYHVENRQLKADHNFVLDQLTLGERVESRDALSLPIKLAVALLKDRNGVIDVDLPVSGSLDDPKFKLGPIIWKAVLGLLTKIVTAPFALLGSLFGGGEEINQIEFAAGSSTPAAESTARIDSVAKALQERPALELEIPLAVNRSLDQPALQQEALRDRLIAIKRRELLAKRRSVDELDATVLEDREEYLRLLRELDHQLRAEELGDPNLKREKLPKVPKEALETEITQLEAAVLPRITVEEVVFADLGKARAEAVRQRLLGVGGLDPARVFITSGGEAANDNGSVRMALALR